MQSMNAVLLATFVTLCSYASSAPLPGIPQKEKNGARDLFTYRTVMVDWYCKENSNMRTAPCMKKRVIDGIKRRSIADHEMATSEAIETVSRSANKADVIKDYSKMFKDFCAISLHEMRKEICENSILVRAYGTPSG